MRPSRDFTDPFFLPWLSVLIFLRQVLVSSDVRKLFRRCIEWTSTRQQLPNSVDFDEWKLVIGDGLLKNTTLGDVQLSRLASIVYDGESWPSIRRELDFDNKIQRQPVRRSYSRTEAAALKEVR